MVRQTITLEEDVYKGVTRYRSTHAPIPSFTKAVNDLLRQTLKERKFI
jgi:hypothetical protein